MKNLIRYSLLLGLGFILFAGTVLWYGHGVAKSPLQEAQAASSHVLPPPSQLLPDLKTKEGGATTAPPVAAAPVSIPESQAASASVASGPETLNIPTAREAGIPVVFSVPNNDPNLNDDQKEKIYEITQSFANAVKIGNTYPDDPDYVARWQKAKSDADDRLRLVLGQEDYLRYMLAAGRLNNMQ